MFRNKNKGTSMNAGTGKTTTKTGKRARWARKTAVKMLKAEAAKKMPPEKFKRYVEALIATQAKRFGTRGAGLILAALGSEKLAVEVAGVYNSIISSPEGEFTTTRSTVPLEYSLDRVMQSGANRTFNSNLYKATANVGYKPTRISRELGKLNGITKINISDTTRDLQDVASREALSRKFGFQQKMQGFVDTGYFGFDYNDMESYFNISTISSAINKEQVAYGMVQNLTSFVRVTNVNKFLPVTIKLHLIKLNNVGTDPIELFPSLVNAGPSLVQDEGAMPRINQFDTPETGSIISTVVVDPKTTGIKAGYEFRSGVDIVKTVTKKLYTGDSLEFTYNHFMGPGIRLDKIAGMSDGSGYDINYPITYALMFEAHGPIVEAISADTTKANRRYSGTGPGLLQFEFKKYMTGVKVQASNVINTGTSQGFLSSQFETRVFTPDSLYTNLTIPRFNVSYDSIATAPSPGGSGVYIPVMSDKEVSAVGTKTL